MNTTYIIIAVVLGLMIMGAILWPIVIMTIVAAVGGPSGSGFWYF